MATMLGEALREIAGLLQDLFAKLSGENGKEWLEALKKFLCKENPWPMVAEEAKQTLLKLVKTVYTASVETFPAEEKFKVGETDGVSIGWVCPCLQKLVAGRVERKVKKGSVRVQKLIQSATIAQFFAELGEDTDVTFSQIWEMLEKQGHGQPGDLLVDGRNNFFRVCNSDGNLWAVYCYWHSGNRYWRVGARLVTDPYAWLAGCRVVSG